MLDKNEKATVMLVKGDQQVPFHDTRAIRIVRNVIEDVQPDYIIDLGDWLDLPDLSTKFTSKPQHRGQLSMVRNIVKDQFEKESLAAPKAQRIWIEGNHEKRFRHFIEQNAEALVPLLNDDILSIPNLVGVGDKVTYVYPYGNVWQWKYGLNSKFIFKHGDVHTRYSAMRELETAHRSGMSGHTHRIQSAMNTTYDGIHGWWSNGCLCNIRGDNCPPGYTETDQYRQWQQGFSVITFSNERTLFQVEPVVIHEGQTFFHGKTYVDNGSLDKKRKLFL